jgi:hypothetical protein
VNVTAIAGIHCKDNVVIGADSAMVAETVIEQSTRKKVSR